MDSEKKDTLLLNVVQCDIPPLPVEERLSHCREFLAWGPQADLWIFPETFATGFSFPPPPETPHLGRTIREWLHETAECYHTAVCGSALVEDNGRYFNRFFLVDASGREQTYDKRHLFSYGHEDRYIAPGHSRELWELHGWKIMPSVCYDLRFPVWSRNDRYYDLLLCVANWPESRIAAWDTLLRARAIENMAYVAGANRVGRDSLDSLHTGHSVILTPLGKLLAGEGPATEECILSASISLPRIRSLRDKYGFLEDRDRFSIEE